MCRNILSSVWNSKQDITIQDEVFESLLLGIIEMDFHVGSQQNQC